MNKKAIFILLVILTICYVCFVKPFAIKSINDTTNQCTKDMQIYENVICD